MPSLTLRRRRATTMVESAGPRGGSLELLDPDAAIAHHDGPQVGGRRAGQMRAGLRRVPSGARATAAAHAPAAAAALVLLAAAGATLFAPVPGSPFHTSLAALSAIDAPQPSDVAPQPDQSVVNADNTAIGDAQATYDQAETALTAAQSAQQAAADLQTKADNAQSTADNATSGDMDLTVQSDQTTVDGDTQSLQAAKDTLTSDQNMLNTDQQNGFDTSYDTQSITTDQSQIAAAQTTLAQDSAKLSADQKAAASSAAIAKNSQAQADSLAQQAKAAQAKADQQESTAQDAVTAADSALSAAKATQAQHVDADKAVVAAWHHQHRLEVADVHAVNAVHADARHRADRNIGIGACLAIAALILLLLDALPLRAARGPRKDR